MSDLPEDDPDITLRDHTYDGIEEFDQKLPNWWLFTLYIAIVGFVLYWFGYYQLPIGMKSDVQKIEAQVALLEQRRAEVMEKMMADLSDESLMKLAEDAAQVEAGKAHFEGKCMACHGPNLGGQKEAPNYVGVSLVDEEWLYGAKPLEIMNTITNGSPDPSKGMIAWKTAMSPSEIATVVAYILSKQPNQ